MAKGLGSAKVEPIGAEGLAHAAEPTQVGQLTQTRPARGIIPMIVNSSGETERIGGYEVVGTLGRGGMGVVYEVVDQASGTIYALKTIETRFLALPESAAEQRFRQEISVLERLDHPGVVHLYDSGFARHPLGYDLAFFAMERLDGNTLDRDIKAGRIFRIGDALNIMLQLSDALDYLSRNGVLHRDIKPGNIFQEAGGRIVLMDFGLARSDEFTRLTLAGQIVGTFGYMSPERLCGRAFDVSSDVYALGVVLFQMISGAHPFHAPSPTETLEAIRRGLVIPPSFTSLPFSDAVSEILRSMLAYHSADRPPPSVLHQRIERLLREIEIQEMLNGRMRPAQATDKTAIPTTTTAPPDSAPMPMPDLGALVQPPPPPLIAERASGFTPIVPPRQQPYSITSAPQEMLPTPTSLPLQQLSQALLPAAGPTWATTGLLTIAAACIAFLAGLLVGRSQPSEVPISVPTRQAILPPSKSPTPPSALPRPSAQDSVPSPVPAGEIKNAGAAFALGERLLDGGQYRPAIEVFNRALVLNPAYADAHKRLGEAHAGVGEVEQALHHYKTYLALRPGAPDAANVRRVVKDLSP